MYCRWCRCRCTVGGADVDDADIGDADVDVFDADVDVGDVDDVDVDLGEEDKIVSSVCVPLQAALESADLLRFMEQHDDTLLH